MPYSYPISASLEQLRGQEAHHPVRNSNTFLIQQAFVKSICSQDMHHYTFLFTRVHSTTVNSVLVSLKVAARVVAAKVAEAVRVVESSSSSSRDGCIDWEDCLEFSLGPDAYCIVPPASICSSGGGSSRSSSSSSRSGSSRSGSNSSNSKSGGGSKGGSNKASKESTRRTFRRRQA